MRTKIVAGLATVYVVWGSTYLGIALAIRSLPPFTMLGMRFALAGVLVYVWARLRGAPRPTLVQWRSATLIGGGLFLVGTGGIAWAEERVHSGVIALVVAVVPLWLALLDRKPLSRLAILGLGLGFGGVALLVGPGGGFAWPAATVVITSLGWAAASVYSYRAPRPEQPLMGAGMQMLMGGVLLTIVGGASGEFSHVSMPTWSSFGAVVYLIVFGSILGFTAYAWLLQHVRTALVGTYAFVNPVVAVLLGALFNGEPITANTVVAGAVIVSGVALIVVAPRRYAQPREDLQPALGQASVR